MLGVLWRNSFKAAGLDRCYAADFGTGEQSVDSFGEWFHCGQPRPNPRLNYIPGTVKTGVPKFEALQLGINSS
jgi:hypothetical protein